MDGCTHARTRGVFELRVDQQGEPPSLVPPAEETPSGLYYLSNLDQNMAVIVQTVYCFSATDDGDGSSACDVLRESLAKVLVHYYPLAGRLAISGEGKLVVDCTGEGAVFVEADADCAMADIGDVTDEDDDDGGSPLLHRSFRFTPASIARVKAAAALEGRACTTFEALAGFVWSARTRALGMRPSRRSKLLFAVDGRPRFSPPLPRGYFGNAIVLTSAACPAGELACSAPRAAAGAVTDAYMRSAVHYFEATRARPSLASTLLITAWSRLPFRAADFGWGPHAALPEKEVALFLSCGEEGGGGVRILLELPPAAMAEFQQLVEEAIAA